jgi:hypothetical protein
MPSRSLKRSLDGVVFFATVTQGSTLGYYLPPLQGVRISGRYPGGWPIMSIIDDPVVCVPGFHRDRLNALSMALSFLPPLPRVPPWAIIFRPYRAEKRQKNAKHASRAASCKESPTRRCTLTRVAPWAIFYRPYRRLSCGRIEKKPGRARLFSVNSMNRQLVAVFGTVLVLLSGPKYECPHFVIVAEITSEHDGLASLIGFYSLTPIPGIVGIYVRSGLSA